MSCSMQVDAREKVSSSLRLCATWPLRIGVVLSAVEFGKLKCQIMNASEVAQVSGNVHPFDLKEKSGQACQ